MYFNADEHNTCHRRDFFPLFRSKISVDHDFSRTCKKEEDSKNDDSSAVILHLLATMYYGMVKPLPILSSTADCGVDKYAIICTIISGKQFTKKLYPAFLSLSQEET
jgi:hypothetical protein